MPWWGWLVIGGGVAVVALVAVLIVVLVVNVGGAVGEAVAKRVEDEKTLAEMDRAATEFARQQTDSMFGGAPSATLASDHERYIDTMERQSASLSGNEGKIARASVSLMRSVQPHIAAYTKADAALMQQGDPSEINSRTDIDNIVRLVRDYKGASERLTNSLKDLPERFEKDLQTQGVPPEQIEQAMVGFRAGAAIEFVLAMHARDREICDLFTKLMNLLKREWAGIHIYPGEGIAFENVIVERQYVKLTEQIGAAILRPVQVQR
jgi:hypothetical protein